MTEVEHDGAPIADASEHGPQIDAGDPSSARLLLTPAQPAIAEPSEVAMTVTYIDEAGASRDVTADALWTVNDESLRLRLVGSSMHVTGELPGETVVSVAYDGLSDETLVTVEPALDSVELPPQVPPLAVGTGITLEVTGIRADLSKRSAAEDVDWTSTNAAVATVSSDGRVQAVAAGTTTIIVSKDGAVMDQVDLTVTDAELQELQIVLLREQLIVGGGSLLVLTGEFADGHTQRLEADVDWDITHQPEDPAGGEVIEIRENGAVIGLQPGTARIRTTFGGLDSPEVEVEVLPADLVPDSITILAAGALSVHGEPVFLGVVGEFGDHGEHVIARLVSAESSNPRALQIGDRLRAMPIAAGPVGVEVRWPVDGGDPVVGQAEIEVVDTPVSGLTISGASGVQPRAHASFGAVEQDVTFAAHWSSSNPACAAVVNGLTQAGRVVVMDLAECGDNDVITAHYRGAEASVAIAEFLDGDDD